MRRHIEREQEPTSVEISFGTLFTVRTFGKETKRIDVVTGIGEDTYFYTAQVLTAPNGKKMIKHHGTALQEYFGRKVGQLSVEEVIELQREGSRNGWAFNDEIETLLRQDATNGSRMLVFDK